MTNVPLSCVAAGFRKTYVDYIGKRMQSNQCPRQRAEVSADIYADAVQRVAGQNGALIQIGHSAIGYRMAWW